MSKTVIYPVCLAFMIISAILYNVVDHPAGEVFPGTAPDISKAITIAQPLLNGQEASSVSLENEIWTVTGTDGQSIMISKFTGKIMGITHTE